MILEDEELNFAIPQEPEFRVVRRHRRVHPAQQGPDDGILVFLVTATLLIFALLIGSAFHSPATNLPTTHVNEGSTSLSQNVQTSQTENQASRPEYFPTGWSFIKADHPIEMYKENQISTIPEDRAFFVSLRNINGFYLAVATDATWNGWIKITGADRQIHMHPDFAGAKKFAEEVDWNLLASSYSVGAPSQEDAQTDLEALRAFEVTTERNDMTLFQKNDAQQDRQQTSEVPEIMVQGERAVIPGPPEPEQQEKRVKLPKTKWFANSEGTQVPSVPPAWGCDVKNGKQTHCTIQDGNGTILFEFYPGGGCEYDGRQVVCRN